MKNKKIYITILVLVLLAIWFINDRLLYKEYDFVSKYEYSFLDKQTGKVHEECRELYKNYQENKEDEIYNSIKLINMLDYLLYESRIQTQTYYEILATLSSQKFKFDNDKVNEINKYMTRKRKTNIVYEKFLISEIYIVDEHNAQVIVIREFSTNKEYLKCRYVLEDGNWKYDGFSNIDNVRIVVNDNDQ
ncbi:hypothetical protein PV797_12070 [Clostridiaceae bacterium M8S5]|nr:hypothetical protein PV797_12070 [Clostridiaceae bacterium M8S5]